ncbi:MAG: hypothetical protein B6I36_07235 [Desulfobacteraceae bacterium 4572_35.1]|nr:MAG: hypothetical protein B6I36_07235 [Desulfobacteraceae bacterium 4572_35.1]
MESAISEYIEKLRSTQKIYDAVRDVCNIPDLNVVDKKNIVEQLKREIAPLNKQLKRLERNEFVVAVVGLEKNGKSTFVNSWLKYDFLPSEDKRCTLSTTKLYSTTGSEHRVKVSVISRDQFNQNIADLKAISAENSTSERSQRAKADLSQIEQYKTSLLQLIENGVEDVVSAEFSDIADALQMYIAEPRYAYAVDTVEVHTPRVIREEGVVFYDVPGLNSGFEVHEIESAKMLGDCDAVILIQDSGRPSAEASEQKLAKFASEAEEHLPVKEKMFIFMNKCDQITQDQVNANREEASTDWYNRHGISKDRIYVGSALAYLLTNAEYVSERTQARHSENKDIILQGVCRSKGMPFPDDENVTQASAIEVLRHAVEKFIKEDRIRLIEVRCNPAIRTILQLGKKILNVANARYPDRLDEAERRYLESWEIRFQEWVDKYILRDVYERINTTFRDELDSESAEKKLYQVYVELVAQKLEPVVLTEEKVQKFLDINREPRLRPERANDQVRTQTNIEVSKALKELGDALAEKIYDQLGRVLEAMTTELWGDLRVEEKLIESREIFERKLKAGIDALLTRFSRPLIEATLVTPRGEIGRKDTLKKVSKDLNALASYNVVSIPPPESRPEKEEATEEADIGSKQEKKGIFTSKRGKSQNEEPEKKDKVETQYRQTDSAQKLIEFIDKQGLHGKSETLSHEDETMIDQSSALVKEEVIEDFNLMSDYLNKNVFFASGVTEFRAQEFRRLLDRFQVNAPAWRGITKNGFNRNDPKLMTVLPNDLKRTKFDEAPLKILDRLRDVLQ